MLKVTIFMVIFSMHNQRRLISLPSYLNYVSCYRCFEMFKIIHTIVDTEEALTMVQRSSSYNQCTTEIMHAGSS